MDFSDCWFAAFNEPRRWHVPRANVVFNVRLYPPTELLQFFMAAYSQNRLRQLQGLVTIDAWHEGVPTEGHVELYAYVNFDEARLGGKAGDEVAFRLLLKRAELRLLQSEPKSFSIDPAKIWRGDQDTSGTTSRSVEKKRARSSDGSASLTIKESPELSLKGGRNENTELVEKLEVTNNRTPAPMTVSFRRPDKSQPSWDVKPGPGAPSLNDMAYLLGQPWHDKDRRLMVMYVNTKHEQNEMLSSIRLCIICKREDLHFYDIMTKDRSGRFTKIEDTSPKLLVIQEYLRSALLAEGLPAPDMESPFSPIYLGEAISEPRRPDYD